MVLPVLVVHLFHHTNTFLGITEQTRLAEEIPRLAEEISRTGRA